MVCVETRHNVGRAEGADQQDGPQRCARHRADYAGGALPPGACEALRSQKMRMLLTHRKLLQSKAIAIENDLRGTLRNFGLKVGMVGTMKFEARIKELVGNLPDLAVLGRIAACRPASATRTDHHPASPPARHRPGRRGVRALNDDPRCRPRGGADLSRHHRRACSVVNPRQSDGEGFNIVLQASPSMARSCCTRTSLAQRLPSNQDQQNYDHKAEAATPVVAGTVKWAAADPTQAA